MWNGVLGTEIIFTEFSRKGLKIFNLELDEIKALDEVSAGLNKTRSLHALLRSMSLYDGNYRDGEVKKWWTN